MGSFFAPSLSPAKQTTIRSIVHDGVNIWQGTRAVRGIPKGSHSLLKKNFFSSRNLISSRLEFSKISFVVCWALFPFTNQIEPKTDSQQRINQQAG
jgi:hypothetical protein